MKPAKHIAPPDWMTAPQTQAVMGALNDPGTMQTLFVGGCVRNQLLETPVRDIDLATIHTPDEVMARLLKAKIRHIPTGIDHGTVTAVTQGCHFEITTLRHDVETDGRHAVVSYTNDWREDAKRRDFTINTLLADMSGAIYDPLGQGLADLQAERVVFVGNPAERIAEDYLRILRFFRFQALYGHGAPNPEALVACSAASTHISSLSCERVTQEILKIIAADNAADTLALMFAHNVVIDLRPPNFDQSIFSRFCKLQVQYNAHDVMARLSLLSDGMLRLSGGQMKAMKALTVVPPDEKNIRPLIYKHTNDVMRQIILLHMARDGDTPEYRILIGITDTWNPPKLPLTGQDVIDLGIKPGPVLGQLLSGVEAWWMAQNFVPDRDACLQQLRQSVQALPPQ